MIRSALGADFDRMAVLVRSCCEELESKYGSLPAAELIVNAMDVALQCGQRIYIDEEGDQVVGVCLWVEQPGMPGIVAGLGTYVHPAFRGRKISSALRDRAESHWKELGFTQVTGTVADGNVAGLQSALNRGFEKVAVEVRKAL
jgi:GNAT superfamily N-acetyltransferase